MQLERIRAAMDAVRIEGRSLRQHIRSRSLSMESVGELLGADLDRRFVEVVFNDVQYEGYVEKQHAEIRRMAEMERKSIPAAFEYGRVPGLGNEAMDVLSRFQPTTLGQAGRLAGVNPTDVMLLEIAIRGRRGAPPRSGVPTRLAGATPEVGNPPT